MNILAVRINSFKELDNTQFCYYKQAGIWYLYIPGCGLGNLANHDVVENPDGTITVKPSILVDGFQDGNEVQRHGYLENGYWRDC